MAYNLLLQDIPKGGIKLPDLPTRIATTHLYWIKYIWEQPHSIMASILKELVDYDDARRVLECRADLASRVHHNHTFLNTIMTTWEKLQSKEPAKNSEEGVLRQAIWDNKYILIGQRPVRWPQWREAGIFYINDLLHDTLPASFRIWIFHRSQASPSPSSSCSRYALPYHVHGKDLSRAQRNQTSRISLPSSQQKGMPFQS